MRRGNNVDHPRTVLFHIKTKEKKVILRRMYQKKVKTQTDFAFPIQQIIFLGLGDAGKDNC